MWFFNCTIDFSVFVFVKYLIGCVFIMNFEKVFNFLFVERVDELVGPLDNFFFGINVNGIFSVVIGFSFDNFVANEDKFVSIDPQMINGGFLEYFCDIWYF